jgi:hypothetical protein
LASAEPAHFWLSGSSTSPGGPESPTINVPISGNGQVHIWGRPMTDRKVANMSLNLIASGPGIDFLDTGIIVYNSINASAQRFELTSDANSVPPVRSTRTRTQVIAGQADSIRGLQGFTQIPSATIRGIGTKCVAGETGCFIAADGQPAWLIASVSYAAILNGSATNLFLQIGERGLNHETVLPGDYDFNSAVNADDIASWRNGFATTSLWADGNNDGQINAADYVVWRKNDGGVGQVELSSLTSIRFGVGPVVGVPEPIYNGLTDRQINFTSDHADAVIQVAMMGSGGGAGVPEPTSLLLLLTGGLVALSHRGVRRPIR